MMRLKLTLAPLFVVAAMLAASTADARATPSSTPMTVALQQAKPPAAAQDEFVPVSQLPAQQEHLPAAPLLIAAYAFVWLMVLLYVFTIWRRLGKVEREIASVSRQIESTRRD